MRAFVACAAAAAGCAAAPGLPKGSAATFRNLLREGGGLTPEGHGHSGEAGSALLAGRVGESPEALRPVRPELRTGATLNAAMTAKAGGSPQR